MKIFDKVFEIIELSFPKDEYRPYEEQKALLDDSRYKITVYNDNGIVKGFMALWEFEGFVFLEHFAVHPDFRNEGTGANMLKNLLAESEKTVCLEVEPPENGITKRRIEFYRRNGFYLNEYPYVQPPISKGKNPVPLYIMTSGKSVSEDEFNCIKDVLYKEVYKCL